MTEYELIRGAEMASKMEEKMQHIEALKSKYKEVKVSGNIAVVRDSEYRYGVVSIEGSIVVPFGMYGWIDGFDSGLARVRTHGKIGYTRNVMLVCCPQGDKLNAISGEENLRQYYIEDRKQNPEKYAKWGIINEQGEEVLPLEYDEIWGFYEKKRSSTKVVKAGEESEVYFHDLNHSLPIHGLDEWQYELNKEESINYWHEYFSINDCYDYEGNFDYERLEDAIMDGEYVPEDW